MLLIGEKTSRRVAHVISTLFSFSLLLKYLAKRFSVAFFLGGGEERKVQPRLRNSGGRNK